MEGWLLCIMKKTKEMINEERKLLRLCSQSYKDMIRKKKVMTVNDFNRFLCVITTLGLGAYEVYFSNQMFPELLKQLAAIWVFQNKYVYGYKDFANLLYNTRVTNSRIK